MEEKLDYNVGLIQVTGESCRFYMLAQPDGSDYINHKLLDTLNVRLPKGHRKGGQSAPRFQRMYLSALDAYIKEIVEMVPKIFSDIKKLIISGNGIRPTAIANQITIVKVQVESKELAELLKVPDICKIPSNHIDVIQELLDINPDKLFFGIEVDRHLDEIETIYSTLDQHKELEKVNWFKSCQFLENFGGCVGVKYF